MTFRRSFQLIIVMGGFLALPSGVQADEKEKGAPVPIKALLVTGGCSHDYTTRKGILVQGIRERIKRPIEWMVKHQGDGESDVRIPLFEESEWAKGYDIVVHDYCFPRVRDGDYIDRILAPHRAGVPAVLIHGTMLSFQIPDDRWHSFTGATIRGHDRQGPVRVEPQAPSDPILKGFQPWNIPLEELYRVDRLAPAATTHIGAHPVPPTAYRQPPAGLHPPPTETPVAWTHLYGPSGTRVFATTLGNDLTTVITPEYLDLLARGFLWSLNQLSDSSFVSVSPGSSLNGLKINLPRTPLPELGASEARQGKASALASANSDQESPGRAIDGQSGTYWESDAPGPASWQVDLPGVAEVGAVAMIWKESPIPGFLLEGSADGQIWKILADVPKGEGETSLSVIPFDPVGLGHFRVSVPATEPGEVPGIREFAVYATEDDVPSGLRKWLPGTTSSTPFRTASESGLARTIRLAPDWSIAASFPLEAGTIPIQLIPTASGNVFLLVEAANGLADLPSSAKPRQVHLLANTEEGSARRSVFLGDLAPGTVISWDGEWLYTLSGGILNAYREIKGEGTADERRRIGRVFSLPEAPSLDALEFSGMRLERDGWIYVQFNSSRAWEAYDSRGKSSMLPRRGIARFQRNGRGFSFVDNQGSGGGGKDFENSDISGIVKADGLTIAARDGGDLWAVITNGSETSLICLTNRPGDQPSPVLWDQVDAAALFGYLESDRHSVQREVIPEILRRKRDPAADLERMLVGEALHGSSAGLFSALTEVNPARSLPLLISRAMGSDSAAQVIAFRLLGDHPEARGHPVFRQITTTTNPEVTSEILRAIGRSGTEIEGLDELTLSFTEHPDSALSEAARHLLISRRSSTTCFEALDDPGRKGQWKGAFDVLCGIQSATVVEGIVLRLERTTSSEFRHLGLEALCRLYFRDVESRRTWEGTRIADLFLRASLHDHRVDRPWLLNTILDHRIPLPEPELVADLAKDELSLEPLAVEAILSASGTPLTPALSAWLKEITQSRNRDEALRKRAGEVLAVTLDTEIEKPKQIRIHEMSVENLVKGLETEAADLESGRRLFRRLACDSCHNIHGEGPASAPDLASSVQKLPMSGLVEALKDPGKTITSGYDIRLFELSSGQQLRGVIEDRDESNLSLLDTAGNSLLIPKKEIRFEWIDEGSIMPSLGGRDLTLPELASLIQYLKSLAPGP